MPNRSQRHLREFYGEDSSGDTDGTPVTPVPITDITITPNPKNIVAPTPIPGDTIATLAAVGGVAPFVYQLLPADVEQGYFRIIFGQAIVKAGLNFQTWASTDPVGAGGITKVLPIKVTDSARTVYTKNLTVNLNIV